MTIKRYDPIQFFNQGGSASGEMKECLDGDYVRFEDIEALLFESSAQPTLLDAYAMSALTGLLARETLYSNVAASEAFKYASEMMKERPL